MINLKAKTIFTFLLLIFFVSTVFPEQKELIKVPELKRQIQKYDKGEIAAFIEKKDRHLKRNDETQQLHNLMLTQNPPTPKDMTRAVNISPNTSSFNFKTDYKGDWVFMGTCQNIGSTTGVFVKINVLMYDSSYNYIGSDFSYILGGSSVRLTATGAYTNALYSNDIGYFKVWTNLSNSQVAYYQYSFTYNTYSLTKAKALLTISSGPYTGNSLGYLELSGTVTNNSANYLTFFTKVDFCVLDASYQVEDVDFTYVDGSTYNYGSGNTDTALSPGETGSFTNWLSFCPYGVGVYQYHSFRFNEVSTSTMPEKDPPFGTFATPIDGSNVASSIAVTGWALDDSGVASVKIYRGTGNNLIYIGDAVFVEGARPDVAAAYPTYPNNTKAGWGYMLLTNFLPNGGNGTFILHAIATDAVGKTTTLGTKTIHCDNANAVKPFGAIDTPGQGGTASGSSFINWGWVLTPQPNSIPTDGSTINVYVDGVNLGHPTYNIYRSDIATFFPTYENSGGAIGYFYLDTTAYENGVHTIQWTAADDAGNTDGIGSRYFTIQNTGGASDQAAKSQAVRLNYLQISEIPVDYSYPVQFRRGFDKNSSAQTIRQDDKGADIVEIRELEHIELQLAEKEALVSGYLLSGDQLRPLPIGSIIRNGSFFWTPGPGFLGEYRLLFVVKGQDGALSKREVVVRIEPRFGVNK